MVPVLVITVSSFPLEVLWISAFGNILANNGALLEESSDPNLECGKCTWSILSNINISLADSFTCLSAIFKIIINSYIIFQQ